MSRSSTRAGSGNAAGTPPNSPPSRDNANMNSGGADGNHPTTNQFLWQPLAASFYAPCVDGDYDFGVYGHEFGHAIENRMIGKGVGARQATPQVRWARRSATSTRSRS